jgi:phosphate:Na+ symporter
LLHKIIPGKDYQKKETRYLDSTLLKHPPLAIHALTKEMVVMLLICKKMLLKSKKCYKKFDYSLMEEVSVDEDSVDEIQKNTTLYISKMSQEKLSEKESKLVPNLLHSINDIERVGDHCEAIMNLIKRKYENKMKFSKKALSESHILFDHCLKFIDLTMRAIDKDDHFAAYESLELENEINRLVIKYRKNHNTRICNGKCNAEASLIYTDLLIHFEKIGDQLKNITAGIVHKGKR